jgi:transcriptional regulator with XRE-family HTH domain
MLANQIIFLRKRAGMSQKQLAEKLNVRPSAIGMYEQGRRTPAIEMLIQMSKLFEVSLDYLIIGTESCRVLTDEIVEKRQFDCPCRMHCVYCINQKSKC